MKRSHHTTRLMTEVEIALLSGCNLAEVEAEVQASAQNEETARRAGAASQTPALRSPGQAEPRAQSGHPAP